MHPPEPWSAGMPVTMLQQNVVATVQEQPSSRLGREKLPVHPLCKLELAGLQVVCIEPFRTTAPPWHRVLPEPSQQGTTVRPGLLQGQAC